MKTFLAALFVTFLSSPLIAGVITLFQPTPVAKPHTPATISRAMQITSPAFSNNGNIPSTYTCDGENTNPSLAFSDVPQDAKSLVLLVDDPDAPMGTWDHWIVFNIPPTIKEIAANSAPEGVQSMTSWGKPGYGGPCPPSGTHHYHFKLYALNTTLTLDASAKKSDVESAMQGHILSSSELVGLYQRQ